MVGRVVGADRVVRLRRRLRAVVAKYLSASILFGLVAYQGVRILRALGPSPDGFALGWIVAGVGASLGSLGVAAAALLARGSVPGDRRGLGALRLEGAARALVLIAAVGAEFVTVLWAPTGMDRGFVLLVNTVLAGSLAVFALMADGVGRAVSRL